MAESETQPKKQKQIRTRFSKEDLSYKQLFLQNEQERYLYYNALD